MRRTLIAIALLAVTLPTGPAAVTAGPVTGTSTGLVRVDQVGTRRARPSGRTVTQFDAATRSFGYAATAHLYRKLTGSREFDAFGTRQRNFALGANTCPADGVNRFAAYDRPDARYLDDVRAWPSSEPAIDFTSTAALAFALSAR